MMAGLNYRLKIALICGFGIVAIVFYSVIVSSLLGLLLTAAIGSVVWRWQKVFLRNETLALNSALRAVCDRDASIAGVLGAAAATGGLKKECHEFAYRLERGQDVISAAAASKMPLQIATAVAMQGKSLSQQQKDADDRASHRARQSADVARDLSIDPMVVGNHSYLIITLIVCMLAFSFMTTLVMRTIVTMLREFETQPIFDLADSLHPWMMTVISIALMIVVTMPLINRFGHWFGLENRYSLWHARNNADVLTGMGEAIRRRISVERALSIATLVTQNRANKKSSGLALELIQKGGRPADVFAAVGWVNQDQRSRLAAADDDRAAELLESFAETGMRDATYRTRWFVAILHPLLVCLVGIMVAVYAIWLHGSLVSLISGVVP